ncbi:hypothetical protein B0T24DRAFT_414017 [Lasiosphaeria ovina]|uniref:Uncharacterized protein n=1 Tax=Lasiosphaeria ovina TaxID=92902 RepID=A0AAE0JY40_9PEZI|nr:hypothetical protein B0T24DRAFT_414017 [Lasiosphaeria ovina]
MARWCGSCRREQRISGSCLAGLVASFSHLVAHAHEIAKWAVYHRAHVERAGYSPRRPRTKLRGGTGRANSALIASPGKKQSTDSRSSCLHCMNIRHSNNTKYGSSSLVVKHKLAVGPYLLRTIAGARLPQRPRMGSGGVPSWGVGAEGMRPRRPGRDKRQK